MPMVSVVIPTRNRPSWLKVAVESVLAQTMNDLEIVVVLNAPTSEAIEMANRLSADPRVNVIKTVALTVPAARNLGMAAAQGEWIAFLDDDDIWLPQKLETQLAAARAAGAGVVTCDFLQFNDDGDIVPSGLTPRPAGLSFAEALLLGNYVSGGSALIVKASIIRAIEGWDERISCCDWDLWRRLSFDQEIHFVDQVLVKYRRHAANRSDEVAFMLPGMIVHFGKMLQDTPPRLRHMFPAAKRQFLDYLIRSFLAEGLELGYVGLAQWRALEAQCRHLASERDAILPERDAILSERDAFLCERDAILSSRSWRLTAPLRKLSLGVRRLIRGLRRLQSHF
jgi:glycosyltransferase involved in cell wall biosynthesis